MVVPFNPWIQLYFTANINVEVVCSALHVIAYLFKVRVPQIASHMPPCCHSLICDGDSQYILKGPDKTVSSW